MDLATMLGILIGAGALVVGYSLDGGIISSLWLYSAFILVIGGSIGSLTIAYGMKDVAKMPRLFLGLFKKPNSKMPETLVYLLQLAEGARRNGLLSIEKNLMSHDAKRDVDPLLRRGMFMVIDGADLEQIRDQLETEIYVFENRAKREIASFEALGGYAPAFGMIGTIMGLVQVLANIDSPEKMSSAIAIAFITTLYGVIFANLFCLPAANKLQLRLEAQLLEKEMILEGVCSIRNGQNPKMIKEKLSIYLSDDFKVRRKAREKDIAVGKEGFNAETWQ